MQLKKFIEARIIRKFSILIYCSLIRKLIVNLLCWYFKTKKIENIYKKSGYKQNFDLIDYCLKEIGINIRVKGLENIPPRGPIICVSNHPLGGADGLALLSSIRKIRPDVKIIVNEYLQGIEPLKDLFIRVEQDKKTKSKDIKSFINSLKMKQAIIIFPAGAVSRFSILKGRIVEKQWKSSIVKLSMKYNIPIVPIYIDAKNSLPFYIISLLFSPASGTLSLPRELFTKFNSTIDIIVGKTIYSTDLKNSIQISVNYLQNYVHSLKDLSY